MSEKLNHFDAAGNVGMLNASRKVLTKRVAVSSGKIFVGEEGYHVIKSGTAKKGDVLGVARIAGITAAKKNFRNYSFMSYVAAKSLQVGF